MKTNKENILEDFKDFAKEKFDIDVIETTKDNAETFEDIFGTTFIKEKLNE